MAATSELDNEFMQYWLRLSLGQKESLLNVAKNFVGLREDDDVADLRKQIIQEERQKYLLGEGKSFSWNEVKEMAVNKDKRIPYAFSEITSLKSMAIPKSSSPAFPITFIQ